MDENLDWRISLAKDLVMVGRRFAFVRPGWIEADAKDFEQLGWNAATVEALKRRGLILFLGEQEVRLLGARIMGQRFSRPDLISLTSDKVLYRVGQDTVRLLIASPQRAHQELRLTLRRSGHDYASSTVALDAYGMCLRALSGLPEGAYEATLEGTQAGVCRFEVAEYRLVPLTAELVGQALEEKTLRFTLLLRAFGQPYQGTVEIELQERGQRVGRRQRLTTDERGRCSGTVELTGAGPYTLNVIAGERTATVALKGSEQERREVLTISELGQVYEMSLLPLPGAEVCRGLYVAPHAVNSAPFLVSQVIGETVELLVREPVELLRVVMVAPATGEQQQELHEGLEAGRRLAFQTPAPYGLLLVGAFIRGKPWEGWCAVMRPSDLKLETAAPARARPGERVTITLRTNRPHKVVPVQLIVKDQRLLSASDPQMELAARIKAALTSERGRLRIGEPKVSLFEAGLMDLWAQRMPPTLMPSLALPMASMAPPVAAATPAIAQRKMAKAVPEPAATAALAPVRLDFAEVIHNSIVYVQGRAEVVVKLGDALTTYTIEAFALDGLDWVREETQLEAQLPVYGDLVVSPFVFAGDQVQGTLHVGAASGKAQVEVRRDGQPLPLWVDGRRLAPGEAVQSGTTVRFPVQPGVFTSIVRDAVSGEVDVSERFVTPPGQVRTLVKRIRLLTAGETLTRAEAGVTALRVLPDLERPFQVFVQKACKYPHGCIEQSSAKFLAMLTGYLTNLDEPPLRDEYESSALAYFRRIQSMYLPERGYTLYPPAEGGRKVPDRHYGPLGTRYQLQLPWPERLPQISQAMAEALRELHRMAADAARAYGLTFPPKEIGSCHDAYLVLANEASPEQQTEAATYVRRRLVAQDGQCFVPVREELPIYNFLGAAVGSRAETAYAAAALLAAGDSRDLPLVIKAANWLTGQLNAQGRLYSTVDTAAALALLLGLRTAGIGGAGSAARRLMLNGRQVSLAEALAPTEEVESVACLEKALIVEATAEVVEQWSAFQSTLHVEVALEKEGRPAQVFRVGDALELVIRVPAYEPGLVAHVCLPDGLARVVGGGQVKRFELDFAEKNELRVPLVAIAPTLLPAEMAPNGAGQSGLVQQLVGALTGSQARSIPAQHWAVLVRNMFKEEQVGNPGLLEVRILP
jgi:hypothetical protein